MKYIAYAHAAELDATFAALANPTRRAILSRLAAGERSVNELAEPFDMSQPAISLHLKVLERAGLVSRGRDAQRRPVRAEPAPLAAASAWLDRYRAALDVSYRRLDAVLEELKALDPATARRAPRRPSRRRSTR
jgi:DNA-binding transcriptional ArsR family regulator